MNHAYHRIGSANQHDVAMRTKPGMAHRCAGRRGAKEHERKGQNQARVKNTLSSWSPSPLHTVTLTFTLTDPSSMIFRFELIRTPVTDPHSEGGACARERARCQNRKRGGDQ